MEIVGCTEGAKACRCEGRMRGVGRDIAIDGLFFRERGRVQGSGEWENALGYYLRCFAGRGLQY